MFLLNLIFCSTGYEASSSDMPGCKYDLNPYVGAFEPKWVKSNDI